MNGKRMNKSVAKLVQGGAVVAAFVVLLPNVVRAERPEFRGAVRAEVRVACDGDFDGDRQVGAADLAILLGAYGYCRNCPEDLDGDGIVDEIDVEVLMESWGICPSSSSDCEGDFDEDGDVGPADLAILLGKYGQRDKTVDLNGDNFIDDADVDVAILMANWGKCEPDSLTEVEPYRSTVAFASRNAIEAQYSDVIVQEPKASKGSKSCPADLDEDGEVGPDDLAILLGRFGPCRNCAEDLTGDGIVDEIDVDVLSASWGICPSSSPNIRDFCEGDFDEDGDVDAADLAELLGKYGQRDRTVDLSGDNFIDDTDVAILMDNWGPCEYVC